MQVLVLISLKNCVIYILQIFDEYHIFTLQLRLSRASLIESEHLGNTRLSQEVETSWWESIGLPTRHRVTYRTWPTTSESTYANESH